MVGLKETSYKPTIGTKTSSTSFKHTTFYL